MNFDDITLETVRQSTGLKWNYYDKDVIPSWIADMDFPVADPIRAFVRSIGERGDLGYSPSAPIDPICDLFAERMRIRYGWTPGPSQMEDMIDIVQGIHLAVTVLCDKQQQVIINTPSYHPILTACHSMQREMLLNPMLKTANGWEVDFDRLEHDITRRTRLLMLVNPHNPTGRVFRRAELQQFADIALRHDLVIVSDEIHCDLTFSDAKPHIPFATLDPEIAQRTVTFNSATKSHNLGGVRCAVVHYGSKALRQQFDQLPARLRGGGNVIGHGATRIAWQQCDDWLMAVVAYLQSNRDYLIDYLAREMPEVHYISNQATYLGWLDLSALGLPEDPAEFLLRKARVACYSGRLFGPDGEGHIRLNFATSRSILQEKLYRISSAVDAFRDK